MTAADTACSVVPPRPVCTHGGGLGMKRQASGTLSICRVPSGEVFGARNSTFREAGPSDQFPPVGSLVPYEVVPAYGSIMDSGDVSSVCSSAYSFAPIKPALRDVLTDLEVHELTKQDQTAIESRACWSSNPFHLVTARRFEGLKGEKDVQDAVQEVLDEEQAAEDALSASFVAIREAREGQVVPPLEEPPRRQGALVPALPSEAVGDVGDSFNSTMDFHANGDSQSCSRDVCATAHCTLDGVSGARPLAPALCQQPAPVQEVSTPAAPLMAFWDVDSRGSAGLNFVFVDDGSVHGDDLWHDDAVTSSSTAMDSADLTTNGMQMMVAQALPPRSLQDYKHAELRCPVDLGKSTPFYDAPASPEDGNHVGPGGQYNVQFDFVSNSMSADQLENAIDRQQSGRFVPVAAPPLSGPELLARFLRSTTAETGQLLAAARKGIGQKKPAPRFVELASCDNTSRSFSDSEASEGRGRTLPGVAVYRNKLFDFAKVRGWREVPVRDDSLLCQNGQSDGAHATAGGCGDGSGETYEEQEGAGSKKARKGGSSPAVESFDSAAKPPRMKVPPTEPRRPAAWCAEIEPAMDDGHKPKTPKRAPKKSGLPERSQLYDSSRSWASHLGHTSSDQRLICHTNRSGVADGLLAPKKLRTKYERRRLSRAIILVLEKLLTCFKADAERRQWP